MVLYQLWAASADCLKATPQQGGTVSMIIGSGALVKGKA